MNAEQLKTLLDAVRGEGGGHKKILPYSSSDPIEWAVWKENFELAVITNRWSNARARRELAGSMTGTAKLAVKDIPIGHAIAAPLEVNLLLNQYEARFCPVAASDDARQTLWDAKQQEGENILGWHGRLRGLYMRSHPEMNAVAIEGSVDMKDLFFRGLASKPVAQQARARRPAQYADCLEEAVSAESSSRFFAGKDAVPHSNSYGTGAMFAMRGGAHTKPITCYRCKKTGHLRRDCTEPEQDGNRDNSYYNNRRDNNGTPYNRVSNAYRGRRNNRGPPRGGRFNRGRRPQYTSNRPAMYAMDGYADDADEDIHDNQYDQANAWSASAYDMSEN